MGEFIKPGFWRSRGARFFMILILTVLLTIPLMMLGAITWERQIYSQQTIREIGQVWGGEQLIAGPFLYVPVDTEQIVEDKDGKTHTKTERRMVVLTPDDLDIEVEAATETRSRGIYDATVYTAAAKFSGSFGRLDASGLLEEGDKPRWELAGVTVLVSDVRAFAENVSIEWNGESHAFEPGDGLRKAMMMTKRIDYGMQTSSIGQIHASIGDPRGGRGSFAFALDVKGSGRMRVAPLGRDTDVKMNADWPHPSFDGAFLPAEREVTDAGFSAQWSVPYLARGFPAAWIEGASGDMASNASRSEFGVSFYRPINIYQKVQRALKYAVLMVGLTFLTIFLIENATGVVTHSVQYLLVGLAQCVFFLLLLALTEHIGFAKSYLASAGATIALITAYVATALRAGRATWIALATLVTLYGFLYLLLISRDYALLIGAIAAFVTIAATMYATRNVNWWADSGDHRA